MTHNYVDIMSRIYVDSTPRLEGSRSDAGAQSRREAVETERLTRVHRRRCLIGRHLVPPIFSCLQHASSYMFALCKWRPTPQ